MYIEPEVFEKAMTQIKEEFGHDPEIAHGRADDLICGILIECGYEKGVEIFKDITKYYA